MPKKLNENPRESVEFIQEIMEDESLPEETKEIFWKEFGEKYINNREFRYFEYSGYILFINDEYIGTFDFIKQIDELYKVRGKYIFYIGDDKIDGKML